MIATDRPRLNLCAACVTARGIENDARFVRVAVDVSIRGACDDCAACEDLEAWRPIDVPEPAPTVPVLEDRKISGLCPTCAGFLRAHERWEQPCIGQSECARCGKKATGIGSDGMGVGFFEAFKVAPSTIQDMRGDEPTGVR